MADDLRPPFRQQFDNARDPYTARNALGILGGAPNNAEYIVGSDDPTLTNDRVLTNTATITWDLTTPGQVKANATATGSIVRNATVAFTSNGTWTKNANLVGVSVEVWGGASGAAQSSTGYGGAGGGYARKWYAAATLGSTVAVTIGAGGAESNSAPGAGGTTTFAASSPVAASGGTYNVAGGSGSGGDINLTGQRGTSGNLNVWGGGGNAPFMSGAGPLSVNAIAAIPNTGCGSSTGTGNPGASGYCLVTEYYSV